MFRSPNPSPPTEVNATLKRTLFHSPYAVVTWAPPADEEDIPIDFYKVKLSLDNGRTWSYEPKVTNNGEPRFDHFWLPSNHGGYVFKVAAVSTEGRTGAYSEPATLLVY
jgi:hypothetical protein